jgi:RNA polymerase sigma-70 factor, ECF subfamily
MKASRNSASLASRPSLISSISSPEGLLQRSQDGDLVARHELVSHYKSIIFSTANRMASNRQDAEDLASEIYIHVFSVINSCKNVQTLPGWIKRVAVNVVYKTMRYKQRQPIQTSLETVVEIYGDSILCTDASQNPATILIQRTEQQERRERLLKALRSLPPPQRILCEMYYAQRRSFEEIARETGLAMGTIKSRLFRAREAMQRKLGDLAYE